MASSERVVGAAENVDKRGPSEPEPYEVDADEEEQTQYNCYVGEKGKHLWQCGYSTLVWSTPMLPRTQR